MKKQVTPTPTTDAPNAGQTLSAEEEEREDCLDNLAAAAALFTCPKCGAESTVLDTMTACKCPKCGSTFQL